MWKCDMKWKRCTCYLSLFNLDFSSSSLSTVEDLNLESSSAYLFWLFSAKVYDESLRKEENLIEIIRSNDN